MSIILPVRWSGPAGLCAAVPYTTNLRLWLDACRTDTLWKDTAATDPVTAHGDSIKRWDDLSGNGFDVTTGEATDPLFDNSTLGFNAVDFQDVGTDTSFLNTSATSFCNASGGKTLIAVHLKRTKGDASGSYNNIFQVGGSGNQFIYENTYIHPDITTEGNYIYTDNVTTAYNAVIPHSPDEFNYNQLEICTMSTPGTGLDITYWQDGGAETVTDGGSVPPTTIGDVTKIYLGRRTPSATGTQFHTGFVCEFLFYDEELSEANRDAVEAYLAAKWNITLL